MEQKFIKLQYGSNIRKIYLPKNFNDLIDKIKYFMPFKDPKKRYLLIDQISNREINNQNDFEKMIKEHNDNSIIKIFVKIIDKTENIKIFYNIYFSYLKIIKKEDKELNILKQQLNIETNKNKDLSKKIYQLENELIEEKKRIKY